MSLSETHQSYPFPEGQIQSYNEMDQSLLFKTFGHSIKYRILELRSNLIIFMKLCIICFFSSQLKLNTQFLHNQLVIFQFSGLELYKFNIKIMEILSKNILIQFQIITPNYLILQLQLLQQVMENFVKQEQHDDYILFTYRSGIQKACQHTFYSSDSGWGCMLRVAQMFIANILYKNKNYSMLELVHAASDNEMFPLSIQTITKHAAAIYPDMKPFEWYSPCHASYLVQPMLQDFCQDYVVSVFNDGSMFLSEILVTRSRVVVLLLCMIGLDQPMPIHLQFVLKLMQNEFFFAIMGGTPKKAHLFVEYKKEQKKIGFLDPHKVQAAHNSNEIKNHLSEFKGKLQWIDENRISSSMCIGFTMKNEQVNEFWESICKLKEQNKECFIYLEKERPTYKQEDCLIQINDDEQ